MENYKPLVELMCCVHKQVCVSLEIQNNRRSKAAFACCDPEPLGFGESCLNQESVFSLALTLRNHYRVHFYTCPQS